MLPKLIPACCTLPRVRGPEVRSAGELSSGLPRDLGSKSLPALRLSCAPCERKQLEGLEAGVFRAIHQCPPRKLRSSQSSKGHYPQTCSPGILPLTPPPDQGAAAAAAVIWKLISLQNTAQFVFILKPRRVCFPIPFGSGCDGARVLSVGGSRGGAGHVLLRASSASDDAISPSQPLEGP